MFQQVADAWSDDLRAQIHNAVCAIAARCDGAHDQDGVGFNGTDSAFGRMLAGLPVTAIDDKALLGAYDMLRKYHGQLAHAGIDYEAIPQPPRESTPAVTRKSGVRSIVLTEDGDYRLVFGYNPQIVEDVRKIPGRSFNAASKSWTVPSDSLEQLETFAHRWSFTFDRAPAVVTPRFVKGTVDLDGDELVLSFAHDEAVHARVKAMPTRRFDSATKTWRVQTYLIRPVRTMAERHGWTLTAAAQAVPDADPNKPPISVSMEDGELKVRFPYSPDLVKAMHGVTDAKWTRADGGFWKVPMHRAQMLIEALSKFGVLHQSEGLTALIRELDELVAASRALDADFDLPGTLGLTPFPFQKAGVAYLSVKRRSFLADHVGLGKTITSAVTAEHLNAFPLIIMCPSSLKVNWVRELNRLLPHRTVTMLEGTTPRRLAGGMFGDPEIIVANYDIVRWWAAELISLKPMGVIADESHLLKEPDTYRTQSVVQVARAVPRPDGMVLCLSATPVMNHRRELASQLDVMGRLAEFGGRKRVERTDDINDRLRAAGCFLRRTKDQVLTELPAAIHSPILIEPDARVMKDYRRAESDLLTFLAERARAVAEEYGLDPDSAAMEARMKAGAAEHLVAVGVLKRIAAQAKMPFVRQWTHDFLRTGEKLLMFATHNDVVDQLEAEFRCPSIRGGQSAVERQAVVDTFQANAKVRMVALNLSAGGVGLTLTAASNVGFVELGWTPGAHDQAIGRVYGRLNDAHGAVGHYFIAQGTIDERVVRLLDSKRREVDSATDGIDPEDRPEGDRSILGDLIVEMTREALK